MWAGERAAMDIDSRGNVRFGLRVMFWRLRFSGHDCLYPGTVIRQGYWKNCQQHNWVSSLIPLILTLAVLILTIRVLCSDKLLGPSREGFNDICVCFSCDFNKIIISQVQLCKDFTEEEPRPELHAALTQMCCLSGQSLPVPWRPCRYWYIVCWHTVEMQCSSPPIYSCHFYRRIVQ